MVKNGRKNGPKQSKMIMKWAKIAWNWQKNAENNQKVVKVSQKWSKITMKMALNCFGLVKKWLRLILF